MRNRLNSAFFRTAPAQFRTLSASTEANPAAVGQPQIKGDENHVLLSPVNAVYPVYPFYFQPLTHLWEYLSGDEAEGEGGDPVLQRF